MSKTLVYILISIIILIVAFITWSSFFEFSISELNLSNTDVQSRKMNGQFLMNIRFAIGIGIYPILGYLISRKLQVPPFKLLIIGLASGIMFWQLRVLYLNLSISNFISINGIRNSVDVGWFKFDIYFIAGLFLGAICFGLIERKRVLKKHKPTKPFLPFLAKRYPT